MSAPREFQLLAYVCSCGDVRMVEDMGFTTMESIFQRRPDGCQYAVVRRMLPPDDAEFLTADLYELLTTDGRDVLLGDYKVFSTFDAALVAAQLQC